MSMIGMYSIKAGWVVQNTPVTSDLYSINTSHGNVNIAWACGENGVILHTTNGGTNWILQSSGTTEDLYAIVFMEISGGPVFACGENGTMIYTTNNGLIWNSINMNTNNALRDISDFEFIAVGDSGVIFKSTNNGMNWQNIQSPVTEDLYAVAGSFGYYAVGRSGTVIVGSNQGQVWSLRNSGFTNDLFGVPLFGSTDIAVGSGGLIMRSTNFGTNWYAQNSFTHRNIRSVEYSVNNTSRIYCAGDSGLILKTLDWGNNWGSQITNTTEDLHSIFFYLDDNRGYACGNNGTILKTTDGGGVITELSDDFSEIPETNVLSQNYPNPFNPVTKIRYELPETLDEYVSLKVFDILGNEVAVLVNENQKPGRYSVEFDGGNLSSGVYFYKLNAGSYSEVKKMTLLK